MPDWMRRRPIAHRGLHDRTQGIFENTLSAARRAAAAGFHIEVDLHPSADGVPMVFHDLELKRLTGREGSIREHGAAALVQMQIGGAVDCIPTLRDLLDLVAGRVGLVLEMKGVHGRDGGFVAAIGRALAGYDGPVAIMSFNPWLIEDARRHAPRISLGLTAEGKDDCHEVHWRIARQADVDFVSYSLADLPTRFVAEFRATGRPVITWTVRSLADAAKSAQYADQITFEGFDPDRRE